MNKLPIDLAMTRFAHTLQTGLLPEQAWTVISWIAFFFKLASLAFAIPLLSLIVFDFCLWIWRLNRPEPENNVRPSRVPRRAVKPNVNPTTSPNGVSSATALAANTTTSRRRAIYSEQTNH